MFSVFADPIRQGELWLSQGPVFNDFIEQPFVFRSRDGGQTWSPVYLRGVRLDSTQVRVLGSGADGAVYIAAGANLVAIRDSGIVDITPPAGAMTAVDPRGIAVDPSDPNVLYLPLRSSGLAYSEDGGRTWSTRNGLSLIHI